MESKVAAKVGIDDGEMLLAAFVSRINGFHTPIKSKDEIIKVQTQAQSIRSSYLFIKLVELKLSAFLLRIVTCIPYITGIDEQGSMKFPEQIRTPFHTEEQLQVSRLIDKVYLAIFSGIATRS